LNIRKLFSSKFVKDNMHVFVGVAFLNLFGFLFHFFMGRTLGPESYGVLGALMAIIGLMVIPISTLQLSISKFVSSLGIKNKKKCLGFLYRASINKLTKIFFLLFVLSFFINIFLSSFLKVEYHLLVITSSTLLIVPFISITRGILQGLQLFVGFSWSLFLEGMFKFLFALLFVFMGYSVGGALAAVVSSMAIAAIYGYFKIKKYICSENVPFLTKEIYGFAKPVFLTLLLIISFYSVDIVLVKHFFEDVQVGYYTVINVIGKIILFASFSVPEVMFPKVVELCENGKSHRSLLIKSFIVACIILVPILLTYFIFSNFIIFMLFGSKYAGVGISRLLGLYGLFMAFVSLSKLFSMYLLSLKRFLFLYVLLLFNILEIGAIWMFHSSISQIVTILVVLGACLFVIMGFFALKSGKIFNS